MVTAIVGAGRNCTIDYSAGEACYVVIKVLTCIKIAWDRVGIMFVTVLTIMTTIWRPALSISKQKHHLKMTDNHLCCHWSLLLFSQNHDEFIVSFFIWL